MSTVIQTAPRGVSPFDHSSIHTASYADLTSEHTSMQYDTKADPESSYLSANYAATYTSSAPSSIPSSPSYTQSSRQNSYSSTPSSPEFLDQNDPLQLDNDSDDESSFSQYRQPSVVYKPFNPSLSNSNEDDLPSSSANSPSLVKTSRSIKQANDDHAIETEPTRHVDYLSHQWREEDIWSSWRYIVSRRTKITNCVRLENASWRTWMKAKYSLKTVSPEKLNWLKDCDVTWLYGPLQIETRKSLTVCQSQPTSQLSTSSSFLCKKPILKKKSASAVILERSRSQQSLLQRASDIIRQQQSSPALGKPCLRSNGPHFRLPSYTGSSVANTPAEQSSTSLSSQRASFNYPESQTPVDQKHVLFDEEVRQVQAIDSDEDDDRRGVKDCESNATFFESDDDEDGGIVMTTGKHRTSIRTTPRGSFSNDNKTIIPLPSTTLKYRTDTPEPPEGQTKLRLPPWPSNSRKLSPSPSQETLRPSRPSHNFLIDDDPEVTDEPWHTSRDVDYSPYEDENEPGPNMRRTPSGMFMPYDENEDEAAMNNTLFGQAAYAVNTFKDIAHVVWNVGWNRK